VVEVEELLFHGHPEVVDADLADYFGSIPHAELMRSLARRIVDRRVLHLIKMWLECPVEETDDRGRKTRTTEAKDSKRGIPQGSPLSPLLANLYMRRFVRTCEALGGSRGEISVRRRAQPVMSVRPVDPVKVRERAADVGGDAGACAARTKGDDGVGARHVSVRASRQFRPIQLKV
jgi:hypothetical protein